MKKQNSKKLKTFQKDDKVYLNIKNLNLKNEMKKLKHIAKELFLIKKNIKNVIYELRILKTRIHKTFNVNSFIVADLIILIIKRLNVKNKKKKYEINKILNERKYKERTKFFIN